MADQAKLEKMYQRGITLYKHGNTNGAMGRWYSAAVDGHPGAMSSMGSMMYMWGRYGEAEQWWRKAVARGDATAMFNLGSLLVSKGKKGEAEQLWRKAAAAGDGDAMFSLGVLLYEQGKKGEAEQWWRKAAAFGEAGAMSTLGVLLYEQGKEDEAEQWWRKAAAAGEAGAMFNLGTLAHQREKNTRPSSGGKRRQPGIRARCSTWEACWTGRASSARPSGGCAERPTPSSSLGGGRRSEHKGFGGASAPGIVRHITESRRSWGNWKWGKNEEMITEGPPVSPVWSAGPLVRTKTIRRKPSCMSRSHPQVRPHAR